LGSGVAIVIGSTIGSGIFKSPSDVAGQLPGPLPMLSVWVVGGIVVLCGALTLGEVGGAYPFSGGIYVYVREAFGRVPAFLFGWASLVLITPSALGALALVFSEYLLRLFGITDQKPGFAEWSAGLAIAAIVVATIANILGVKQGALLQNVTVIAKVGGLLLLIVLALAIGLPKAGGHFTPAAPPGSFSLSMFGLALVSILWTYDGWADASYVSGEFANPRKNVPRAILFGTLIVVAVCVLANVAYMSVFTVSEIGKSSLIAADSMTKLVGAWGVTFIVATVMISTFGTLSATTLTSPRIFFAMAEDRLFFAPLAVVHPRFRTPHRSIVLTCFLGIVYVLVATVWSGSKAFGALTDAFVIGIVPFYTLSVASVFIFRRRKAAESEGELPDSLIDPVSEGQTERHVHPYQAPVRTPLYPLTPLVFIAGTLFLLASSLLDKDSRVPTLITLGILAVGIPIYYATIGRLGRT
jgi:amino acid transporter